jgi:hypothetical protein
MNYESLGCCGVSQPHNNMRHIVEARDNDRNMEDLIVAGEKIHG